MSINMSTSNLLVELFVEELPPKALDALGQAFSSVLADSLRQQGLASAASHVTAFASPRRLAAHLTEVAPRAADKPVSQKLMPVSVGLDGNGQATPALLKKLAALGLDASAASTLKRAQDGKTEALFHDSVQPGVSLAEGLQKALEEALTKLPIPKVMTYQLQDGWRSVKFVRPAHGLVALHGSAVVPIAALGLSAGNSTRGHRFEAASPTLTIASADSYARQLEAEGAVIPGFAARRAEIARQIAEAAQREGLQAIDDPALLDEVTALVERPNVLICRFEEAFLQVPQECLILTMKANQKYFPLLDAQGQLSNRFLVVSNIRPADPSAVIGGNERVIRPRLADARFFFDQDRKVPLAERVKRLDNVVYHNKLGTQGQRIQRLLKLAAAIANELGADAEQAARAALLAKADLVTDMVGEFPELQGIMGRYYARHDGEPEAVADAIEAHYKPRFAGDSLPAGPIAAAVALADKLDALTGIFGIGLTPTGDKDPFALRRAALGVLRILMESGLPLDLMRLLRLAHGQFAAEQVAESTPLDVFKFMLERLRIYLKDQGHPQDEVEAVVCQRPTRIDLVPARLAAVRAFRALPESTALAAANKRIQNLLRKAEGTSTAINSALIQAGAEADLFAALQALAPTVESALEQRDYTTALTRLASLKAPVDRFFDEVMVMVDEPGLRANRLALLGRLGQTMNSVADISELNG